VHTKIKIYTRISNTVFNIYETQSLKIGTPNQTEFQTPFIKQKNQNFRTHPRYNIKKIGELFSIVVTVLMVDWLSTLASHNANHWEIEFETYAAKSAKVKNIVDTVESTIFWKPNYHLLTVTCFGTIQVH